MRSLIVRSYIAKEDLEVLGDAEGNRGRLLLDRKQLESLNDEVVRLVQRLGGLLEREVIAAKAN